MNEITIPALIPAPVAGNLTNLISERAHFEPQRVIVSRPLGDGWQAVTAKEYEEEIKAVAKGLIAAGISFGDRVAIMAKTRYEWTVLDFAIWYAGAVPVPIYETSSAEQVEWILTDSAAVAIIVETPALAELVQPVLPAACKRVWNITYNALATLTHEGKGVSDDEIAKRRERLKQETLATLIYTSGTTGKPKCVQITHGNF
ncbi:MAG: AMP-binding protein [Candidatus Nanopelagicus sp.]